MNDIKAIKAAADRVKGWSNCDKAWLDTSEDESAAMFGAICEEGVRYPVATVDCDQYMLGEDSLPLAKFYATANPATVIALCDEVERLRAIEESRDKAWAVAKSLQAQVNILLPVVWAAADNDDEYGIGPKARKALEALAAHKET